LVHLLIDIQASLELYSPYYNSTFRNEGAKVLISADKLGHLKEKTLQWLQCFSFIGLSDFL